MILAFGKYNGMDLRDVPRDYIDWLLEKRREDVKVYEDELTRRDLVEQASQSVVERIVQAGYRELAKKAHPDTGGTTADFQALQAAHEQLKAILKEVERVQTTSANADPF